ncbi:MAG: SDR family NAD(P)-dependent oxidoreductase, partial [Pseudomonadota bacterium]
ISDNRLGGWYGYRAAKAALNMLIRNLAIEWQRKHKRAIIVALHPGTVDTRLSEPFQSNVPPGKLFDSERAAMQLLDVLEGLKPADTGRIFAWDGEEIAP